MLADYRTAPITDKDKALLGFIDKVNRASTEIGQADIHGLHAAGWNDEAIDLAELGVLVRQASERAEPAAILLEPDARARYLRVDEAIGAIRRNGGTKLAFPGIEGYAGLI